MEIRITSTLTPDDENRAARVILENAARLLDLLPIAYVIQIDTSDGHSYHHEAMGDRKRPGSVADKVRSFKRLD